MASDKLYVASVIASYWLVSISMVYLNKVLLSSADTSIAAPLFITWYQCVVTCFICYGLGEWSRRTRMIGNKSWLDEFPPVSCQFSVATTVLPLSLIFVGMIAFNNFCLQYVQVSFCKSAVAVSS